MNALIEKVFGKTFLFKITIVFFIILENVFFKYQIEFFQSTNYITVLIENFTDRFFVYEIFFISIFILSYDSISEVYLKNETAVKMSRKKILLNKIFEFTWKYVSVLLVAFTICFVFSIASGKIEAGFSWDSSYMQNEFGSNLITKIPAFLILLEILIKYYFAILIVFMFGYYIYIITNSPVKGVVSSIAVIISLITIGKDAALLMVRGDKVMEILAKLTINYNMGTINYYNITSMNSFLIKESISFIYLLVLVLVLYIMCESKIMKKDVL